MPFPTCFRWPKGWCDRPNRTDQPPIHCTSAPARIWPQGHAGPGWPWPHSQMGIWETSRAAKQCLPDETNNASPFSLSSVSIRTLSTYIRTRQRGAKGKRIRERNSLSLRLWQCAEAQTLDRDQPERSLPCPSQPTPPRTRRKTTHTTTTSLCQHCSRARINQPPCVHPTSPASQHIGPSTRGKARAQKALDQNGKPRPLLSRPQNPSPKVARLAHLQKLAR